MGFQKSGAYYYYLLLDFYLRTLQINSDGGSLDRLPNMTTGTCTEEKEEQSRISSMKFGSVRFWILVFTFKYLS